jgi:hypothetical protein
MKQEPGMFCRKGKDKMPNEEINIEWTIKRNHIFRYISTST